MFAEKLRLVGERIAEIFAALGAFLPAVLVAAAVFLAGWFLARLFAFLIIRAPMPTGPFGPKDGPTGGVARTIRQRLSRESAAHLIFWLFLLLSAVLAFEVLGLPVGAGIVARLLGTVPQIFAALLIFIFGFLVALLAESVVRGLLFRMSSARPGPWSKMVRWVVLVAVVLMAVEQFGLAAQFVLWLVLILVGAAAFAFALAFGLGCKDLARDLVVEFFKPESPGGSERQA